MKVKKKKQINKSANNNSISLPKESISKSMMKSTSSEFTEQNKSLSKFAGIQTDSIVKSAMTSAVASALEIKELNKSLSKFAGIQTDSIVKSAMTSAVASALEIKELNKSLSKFAGIQTSSIVKSLQLSVVGIKSVNIPNDLIDNILAVSKLKFPIESINDETFTIIKEEEIDYSLKNENKVKEDSKNIIEQINTLSRNLLDFPNNLKEKQPFLYIIYYIFVYTFIWNIIIVPVLQDKMKEDIKEIKIEEVNYKKNIHEIKNILRKDLNYDFRMVNKVRVTNRTTVVYRSNKRKSGIRDMILPNKPVIIIKKNKNWSLITYTNHADEEATGWVFTNNLKR